MSYFYAGFGAGDLKLQAFDGFFPDTVPCSIRKTRQRLDTSTSHLVRYGSEKPIRDTVILDATGDCWLALLGTPLMDLPSESSQSRLVERFKSNPNEVLRNDIDGSFAALFYSESEGSLLLATDYNNTVPVYYTSTIEGIYVSSHELALAKFLGLTVDPEGFSQTIQLKLTWGSLGRFKGIKKALPCQIVTFRKGIHAHTRTYWEPSEESLWQMDFDATVDRWSSILRGRVKSYYDCSLNKKVICDITAGEDSRLLVSHCHALGLPYTAQVTGHDSDTDVIVAREASRRAGFELIVHPSRSISQEQLVENATHICLLNDGYQDYFRGCTGFAEDQANPPLYFDYVKYCGAPGGEAFRGSYYLRGKAFLPSANYKFDSRFFVRMKYLLDYHPGLMRSSDLEWRQTLLSLVDDALGSVEDFPVGIKIDHLLRVFQTCNGGLIFKNPRYLPFATREMTRSLYSIWPHFKRGGSLTKACTEILYPELAWVKTQNGVPTVRRTPLRLHLFLPEYVALAKHVASGALGRLLKMRDSNKSSYSWSKNAVAITTMMTQAPFSSWFSSPATMITGHLYNSDALNRVLSEARAGGTKFVPILGRIFSQELACRWVYQ